MSGSGGGQGSDLEWQILLAENAALRAQVDDMFTRNTAVKLIIDPDGGAIVDANPAAAAFYGWSQAELRQLTIMDLNQLPTELIQREMDRAREERRSYFEFKHRLRSGEVRDVQVYSGPCTIDGRRVLFSVICDITERNQLAEQLGHAQRMEALGRLAGGVAHDFNNLLTTVEILSGIIGKRAGRGQDVRSEVAELGDLVTRGEGLTRQLLAFCRRQVMRTVLVDLAEVLSGMEVLLARLIGDPVELRIDVAAKPVPVIGDPLQLEQVVLNLALNGRDAMPGGGRLVLAVSHAPVDEARAASMGVVAGSFVLLTVTDDGVGIDADKQRHIFEPFYTTKRIGEGTGLGLATAYGIVRQSGGAITLESVPGRGSTFRVWLPRAHESAAALAPPVVARGAEATGGAETILVAEDEPSIRRAIRQVLEDAGYHVLECSDGHHGLEVARAHGARIDLLLTDVVMPRAGGRELARELTRLRPELRVLYMSGHVDSPAVDQGMRDVAEAFLAKPFTGDLLLVKLREVLLAPSRHPAQDGW